MKVSTELKSLLHEAGKYGTNSKSNGKMRVKPHVISEMALASAMNGTMATTAILLLQKINNKLPLSFEDRDLVQKLLHFSKNADTSNMEFANNLIVTLAAEIKKL